MKEVISEKEVLKMKLENKFLKKQSQATSGKRSYIYKILVIFGLSLLIFTQVTILQILFYPLVPIFFLLEKRILRLIARILPDKNGSN